MIEVIVRREIKYRLVKQNLLYTIFSAPFPRVSIQESLET
jgi:hypothetical protein